MEIFDSPPAGGCDNRRNEAIVATVLGLALLGIVVAWEIRGPSLPVPFELASASRAPLTASWLGRLPMALTAIAGCVALYMFLARTAERRSGIYAVAILATVPAWFVHGRMMTGAIVPMACSTAVLAGLGVAVLARDATARVRAVAASSAVVAALAAVVAARWGVPNRGLAVVAGMPAVAVGAAALLWKTRARAGAVVLALGAALVATGATALVVAPDGTLATHLLGTRATVTTATTFESPVASLAYGLVPWTPLVPFAIARRPTSAGHLATMIAAVLAIAVHAALAPRSGPTTIVGVAAIAGSVATMLRSLEQTRRPAVGLVAAVVVFGWLVAHDVGLSPDRVLVAFGATDAAVPRANAAASSLAIRSSLWLSMLLTCVALLTPRSWLPAGRGLAIVAGGVFAGALLRAHAYPDLLARMSPGAAFDAWAHKHRPGEPLGLVGIDRRTVAFAPGTAVVVQADPPTAGRWLATSATDAGATDAGANATSDAPRRFLALGSPELPRVNAEYRAARGRNVPVLAGHETGALLATSALARGERSENPLDAILLDAPPSRMRPLDAVLDDKLDTLGWQLTDAAGRPIDAIPRGSRTAHVRVIVRARAAAASGITGYCTFLHIDHSPSRFSAEHRDMAYPMALWRAGDVLVDDYDVKLPAHFRAGSYALFWGVGALPCEDDRRMHVTSGPSDGHDRVVAGRLEVR